MFHNHQVFKWTEKITVSSNVLSPFLRVISACDRGYKYGKVQPFSAGQQLRIFCLTVNDNATMPR
jgi:hypothetical protein